jgi:translation initiation factor 1
MGVVFDSATGGTCPRCRKRLDRCACARQIAAAARPTTDGVVRIRREVRNGKAVTVVFDLPLRADELASLAGRLKAACGSGGTAKDGCIEIQGDHRDKVAAFLQKAGHTVKFAGG